jgi:hypothetical protein
LVGGALQRAQVQGKPQWASRAWRRSSWGRVEKPSIEL